MINVCTVCKIEFESVKPAKTCSPKCRKLLSRQASVTPNVTLEDNSVTPETFKFTVKYNRKPSDVGYDEGIAKGRAKVREAKYWYDVPLGAVPVKQKDWPEIPIFETDKGQEPMNGRQYFLWWKNNFETGKSDEPVILNPLPVYDNVRVELGGESSRRWGA